MTTPPKWTRPDHPATPHTTLRHNGRNWTAWVLARQAIADAEHAGDPQYAARILSEAAWELVRHDRVWGAVRPPLGVRRGAQMKGQGDAQTSPGPTGSPTEAPDESRRYDEPPRWVNA